MHTMKRRVCDEIYREQCDCTENGQYIIKIQWNCNMGIEYIECNKEEMEQEVLELAELDCKLAVYEIADLQIL